MTKTAAEDQVRVLLVDDDEDDFVLTRELLAEIPGNRFRLERADNYDDGLVAACSGRFDVILLDYKLGHRTGLELLTEMRQLGADVPVVFLTGLSNPEIDLAAMYSGAVDYIEKSRLDATLLERTLRYAIQQKQIESELERRVRERTEELDRANEALREANRRKDEFLATLAHELRNPLAPIRNALEVLRLSGDAPQAVSASRSLLDRQVAQLVRLIDDLLDVSRMSLGKLRLINERIAISIVIDAAVEQSRPLLDAAGLTLTVDVPTAPIYVLGDRVRLAQIFANLLNNAAKYTDRGGRVLINVASDDTHVRVCVRDTGIGISAEMLPMLFEPFTQIDRNLNRAQGGLGIGLSLVRQLAELHGGSVSASSQGPGHGAEFIVTLPHATN